MTLLAGDCLGVMAGMDAGSIDAIVTDPPYGLGFMGKGWDHGAPGVPFWAAAIRVLRPGGHLLAFGGTRTFHRLTCAIEDAGFEIRDCLSWLYGSGFPKSHNGPWGGTALKPAWEPIILARKPLVGTVAANVLAHGTGALNVDGCRIGTSDRLSFGSREIGDGIKYSPMPKDRQAAGEQNPAGRWPANVILDPDAARAVDEQSGERTSGQLLTHHKQAGTPQIGTFEIRDRTGEPCNFGGDSGGASRFFYTAKASRGEREEGMGAFPLVPSYMVENGSKTAGSANGKRYERHTVTRNAHPTVKPVALMRWLVRLVTPPGGTVLDPFMGSGTTGIAAKLEGFEFVGIEREAEYLAIAERRIANANSYALAPESEEQPGLFGQAAFEMDEGAR